MTDTTPPRLLSLGFPRTVDLSSGARTITFAASASDDSSGINYVNIIFDKSFSYQGSSVYLFGTSDSWADGSSTTTESIPVNSPNGTYTISQVNVFDNAGNESIYTTSQLINLGIGTTITVSGADTSGPQLTALNFDPTIDLSAGDATFHFSASATDRSGIGNAIIRFNGLGSYYIFGSTADSWADGSSSSTDTVRVSTPPGTYTVSEFDVTDAAGNPSVYTTAQLQALGFRTSVNVTGSDTAGPTLTALNFDPTIDLSAGNATFHFAASATDRSGIGSAILRFNGLGSYYIFGSSGDSWADGSSSSTDSVSVSQAPGTYGLSEVDVQDTAGNTSVYTASQLQALGFKTTVVVSNSDVTGPTLTNFTHPTSINLSGGAAPITFGISATDRRGIEEAIVRFDKPLFGSSTTAYLFGTNDSWTDGSSTDTETIPVSTAAGTYTVTGLDVYDTAGNITSYTTSQIAALGYSTSVVVSGADTTAPQLTSLAFPATIDVSGSAKTVTFAASATDNATGVKDVTLHFDKSFFGGTGGSTIDIAGSSADPWTDGSSSLAQTIPTTAQAGVYTLTSAVVTDGAGNTHAYTTAQLQALGIATSLTVKGDATKPTLTALTFPTNVDVSSGARNEPFTANATDNATGIRDVLIHFDKDLISGTGVGSVDLNGASDSWTDGSSTLSVIIPSTAKSGTYTITDVDVTDGAGNVQTYTTTQLSGLGIGTSLTITGGATTPDTVAPQLTALTFPTSVDVSGGAQTETFSASATDNASGVHDVLLHFDKDLVTGSGPGSVSLNGTGDSWADGSSMFSLTIPANARSGTYTITGADVTDNAGNVRSYTTAQLATLGIATGITITGGTAGPDTTVPQLTSIGIPTNVDVSGGAQGAHFLASATDNASGVKDVTIRFDKDLLGGTGTGVIDIAGNAGDSWLDGSSSLVEVIPTTARSGTYTITSVDVTDGVGNVGHYTAAQIAGLGYATSMTITGGSTQATDTQGPQVASVAFTPVVNLASGGGFSFAAPATDQTGVQGGVFYLDHTIQFTNGSGTYSGSGFAFNADGTTGSTFLGAVGSPIYEIGEIDYTDTKGQTRTYSTAQLAAFGLQTAFFLLDASFNVSVSAVIGGTYGVDTLYGTSANNVIYGLEGNDTIYSKGGIDWLYGGTGDDTYFVSDTSTHIFEAVGAGYDTVNAAVSYTLAAGQEIESLRAGSLDPTTPLNLGGNEFANFIVGNAGANVLFGGGGSDYLDGGDGIDTADYSDKSTSAVVTLNGSITATVYVGGVAEDTIVNVENIIGGFGADTLTGDGGANVLRGGLGKDVLDGGAGLDTADFSDKTGSVVATLSGTTVSSVSIAGVVEDTIVNFENLIGGSASDTLTGDGFVNVLDGGAGADRLYGMGGDDIYHVDNAGDQVFESAGGGTDTVFTSVTFTLTAGQQIERMSTTSESGTTSISLTGNEFANTIRGNAGADTLDGGAGADLLYGLGGDDIYYVDNVGDQVFESSGAGNDTVVTSVSYALALGAEVEVLQTSGGTTGTAAINLTGNQFANKLIGNAGANVLDGAGGIDTMYGYAGNDTYIVDNAADRVFEAAGGGADVVRARVSYTLAAGQEIETLITDVASATTSINLTGNEYANAINGNAGNNIIDGSAGADIMSGGGGDDTYIVDNAADRVYEAIGNGTDILRTSVSYALAAGQEIETLATTIAAGTVAINLSGNEFANTLIGNAGANALDGKGGADTMIGGGGNDTYIVDSASDKVVEIANGGTDIVRASVSYTLAAGQSIEQLSTTNNSGTTAIDLTGNEFANTLIGNAAANTLDGGFGTDTMYGGAGSDTFVFDTAIGSGNIDSIADFTASTAASPDAIALSRAIFTALAAGPLAADAFEDITSTPETAAARILYNHSTGALFYDADGSAGTYAAVQFATLTNKAALTAADFEVIAPYAPLDDFDGNGVSDIFFRNDATGAIGYDTINANGTSTTFHALGASSTAYAEAGIGDFSGDGLADILFRASNGSLGYDTVNSNGTSTTFHAIGASSTAYGVAGVGDFDGDGKSDILFRNDANGGIGYDTINANGSSATYHPIGGSGTAYTVAGVGDFDGDGKSDILFRNNASNGGGAIGYDTINGNGTSTTYHALGGSGTAYTVAGVGDFDGDGLADILFRNNASNGNGAIGYDTINANGTSTTYHAIGGSGAAYAVVGTGDYNGDGISDILFRNNANGALGYDTINANGTSTTFHPIGGSGTAYTVHS